MSLFLSRFVSGMVDNRGVCPHIMNNTEAYIQHICARKNSLRMYTRKFIIFVFSASSCRKKTKNEKLIVRARGEKVNGGQLFELPAI